MRFRSTAAFLASAMLIPVSTQAQQTSQVSPQRDPQAVALLTQTYLNMGGATTAGITDFRAAGRVFSVNDSASPAGTFDAKLRGKDFSMETIVNSSQFRYCVLNGRGSANRNGQVKPLPPYNTMGLSLDIFPLFARWTEFAQGAAVVAAPTDALVGGVAAYSIRLDLGDSGALNDHGKIEVLIDRASDLVVALRYQATLGPYVNYKTAVENRFANYKDFGGILLPTQVTRYINGQPAFVFVIDQVQANNGFTDGDFRN